MHMRMPMARTCPRTCRSPSKSASAFSHSPARSQAAMAAEKEKALGETPPSPSCIAPSSPTTRAQSPPLERAAMTDE